MNKLVISLTAVLILALAGVFTIFAFRPGSPMAPTFVRAASADAPVLLPLSANALDTFLVSNPFGLTQPVIQFQDRITKKNFGIFITPETSPVDGDRFSGFHTGVDAEFTETGADIPVVAIAPGVVTTSARMNGYGGVVVVKHVIAGIPVFALYGHLDPASMVPAGTAVAAGTQLGILGDDHSEETDGVRKHLHFSLYGGEKMDFRGYVATQAELAPWLDPLNFYPR